MKKNMLVGFLFVLIGFPSCSSQGQTEVKNENGLRNQSTGVFKLEDYPGKLAWGTIRSIKEFPSSYVQPRNVDVWLPEGYSKDKEYAVLYMHDGQMLFDGSSTWNGQEWKVDETLMELMTTKAIRPTIVVGIWNHPDIRFAEYFPKKPFSRVPDLVLSQQLKDFSSSISSDDYLRFIVEELKPYIDSNFSTSQLAADTFVAGSSMGGLISMYAICEYPEVFSGAACLSTHWVGIGSMGDTIPTAFFGYMREQIPNPKNHDIYFDYGTETLDAKYLPFQAEVDQVMKEKKYDQTNFKNLRFEGHDHSESSWSKRLHIPLKFLLAPK